MDRDRDAFLAAIDADPCDCDLREIYADWLEEHGETEAAGEQRGWRQKMAESKAWIEAFAVELGQTYEDLLHAARKWLERGDYTYDNTETYKYVPYEKWPVFWTHHEIVTGKKAHDPRESFFTCSC